MEMLLRAALQALDGFAANVINKKKITVGFDGCVDSLCRVVKRRNGTGSEYFNKISEFGEYIIAKNGMSGSVELSQNYSKFGGNAPILSDTLGRIGMEVNVVAMLGEPIQTAFKELSDNCNLLSYAPNTIAISLEFLDGKFILAPKIELCPEDAWQRIESAVGQNSMKTVFNKPDLLCMLNWSELSFSTGLWRNVFTQVEKTPPDKSKFVLFDLCDCNGREDKEITEVLGIIEKFVNYRSVVLSMNDNEALRIYEALTGQTGNDFAEILTEVAKRINLDFAVIHTSKKCYSYCESGIYETDTQFQESPKVLTGGGDNFNAGYCLGLLLSQPPQICNLLGNAVSCCYIKNGKSPDIALLRSFLTQWLDMLSG